MKVKRKVLSIFLMLLIIPLFISQLNLSAAPPEDINYNAILELMWSNSSTITEGEEYHLINDEFDGNFYTIPAIATYSLTAVMGNIAAYNSVGAIYPGHSVAYEYYIFMVDQEELHFYDFKWSYKAKVPFDELVSVTTDDPLISNNTVSIQYNVDNEIYEIQIVNKGSQLTFPDDPEKENHVFVGWFLDPMFYYPYDSSNIVVNGFQLYAKFQLEDISVKLFNGYSLVEDISVEYGKTLPYLPSVSLNTSYKVFYKEIENITFEEAYLDVETNKILFPYSDLELFGGSLSSGNLNLYKGNELIFLNSYQGLKAIELEIRGIGQYFTYLDVYISSDLENWEKIKGFSMIDKAFERKMIDVKKIEPIYIKFHITTGQYRDSAQIKYIKFLTDHYYESGKEQVFDMWYYDEHLTKPYYEDDIFYEDTNLYAGYKEKEYTLSFDSNNGSPVTSQLYYEDDLIVLPEYNPSRIGYVFAGWYLDEEFEEEFNLELMPGDDVVLYAKWEEITEPEVIQHLIEFYLGENLYTFIALIDGDQLILPSAPPTAENQIFLGWFYDEEFTEQFKVTDLIEDDVTLYGKFGSSGSGGTETPPEETPGTEFKLEKKYVIIAAIVFVGIGLALIIRKRK